MMELIYISCLVALVAYNVTKQAVFEWLRNLCDMVPMPEKMRKLYHCHYCLSHWVSGAVVLWSGYRLAPGFIGFVETCAVIVVVSQPIMVAMDWTIDMMDSFKQLFARKGR